MRLACLFSGGKDSTFALFKALKQGHEIAALVSIKAAAGSFMYHTPNIHLAEQAAEAMEMPLVVGEAENGEKAELQAMQLLLSDLKKHQKIEGVLTGAIASNYQKKRVDLICKKLRLQHIAPLWHREQAELLREMLRNKFSIMVTAVAALGLNEKWLGRMIDEKAVQELVELQKKFSINPAGEGGELETLVLDCPLFKKKLCVLESEKRWDGVRGELVIKKVELMGK